jgi:hypothetical protein
VSLLGWRQWAVDTEGRLRPAWTPWSPFPPEFLLWRPDGLTRARCLRGRHPAAPGTEPDPAPAEGCVCGLYAWRDPTALVAAARPRWTARPIIVGAVRLGGRMIVAERGYRAELGYPAAIVDPLGVVSAEYSVARYRGWPELVAEWNSGP